MRKNFTQLFLGLALMVGFVTMGNAQCEIDPPPGAYYNFQFDGGLEGWRTLDGAGFETSDGWIWSDVGDIGMGAYGPGAGTTITSESQCNGAMVFDSDFLDNNGVQGNFGAGACPSPCNGYLVSPVMDFSAATTEIELMYHQAVRQFQSEFYVYVSVDGGASNRDTFTLNDGLVLNDPYIEEMRRMPLCDLRGEANVVIQFHYVGDYYFWTIDDVSLVEANPNVDMRVNSNFYSKVANYATPGNMGTTVPILADIENVRANDNPASVLNFRVRNEVNQEIFSATRNYGPVAGCSTDENKLFDDFYTMPTEEGFYSVEFEIEAEGDDNPDNDIVTAPFKITDREFRKLPTDEEHGSEFISGFRYGDALISWGSYFQMPSNPGGQAIESVTFGWSTSTADPVPNSGFINVGIYEWIDFDNIGTVDPEERVLLGEADFIIGQNFPADSIITLTVFTPGGDSIIVEPLNDMPNQILVVMHNAPFNGTTNYFFRGVDQSSWPIYSGSATQLAHREADLVGGYGSFMNSGSASHDDRHDRELINVDAGVIWDVSMMLSPRSTIINTEDINEDLSVNVFPSPASEKLNVELNLEEVSQKVSIELLDMTGNSAGIYNFTNVKKDRLSIDVSQIPGGMYLMNVRTEEGMISKKISVIH